MHLSAGRAVKHNCSLVNHGALFFKSIYPTLTGFAKCLHAVEGGGIEKNQNLTILLLFSLCPCLPSPPFDVRMYVYIPAPTFHELTPWRQISADPLFWLAPHSSSPCIGMIHLQGISMSRIPVFKSELTPFLIYCTRTVHYTVPTQNQFSRSKTVFQSLLNFLSSISNSLVIDYSCISYFFGSTT